MLVSPGFAIRNVNNVGFRHASRGVQRHTPGGDRRPFSGSTTDRRALTSSLGGNTSSLLSGVDKPESQHLRMVMFGKPGAGKGTMSARLVQKYDIVSISTGDLLRQHIAQGTDVGRQAKEIVASGGLLPDELMLQVVASKLDAIRDKHWILDGFPRTVGQGELLDEHLRRAHMPLTLLATLSVPERILRARISERYVHPASGRVYNLTFSPPRVPGRDDVTGEPLIQRPDDTPEVYERRLRAYDAATAPLLGYYAARATNAPVMKDRGEVPLRIISLEGETSDEMWPGLEGAVREFFPAVKSREDVARAAAIAQLTAGEAEESAQAIQDEQLAFAAAK